MLTKQAEKAYNEDKAMFIKQVLRDEEVEERWRQRGIRADEKHLTPVRGALAPDTHYKPVEWTVASIRGFVGTAFKQLIP